MRIGLQLKFCPNHPRGETKPAARLGGGVFYEGTNFHYVCLIVAGASQHSPNGDEDYNERTETN